MSNLISIEKFSDEDCKQLFYSNEYLTYDNDLTTRITITNRIHLILFSLLILTSQSSALPIPQVNSNRVLSLPSTTYPAPVAAPYVNPSVYSGSDNYKFYRPNYLSNSPIQVYDQTIYNNNNQQQALKRERYRRTMIDRIYVMFDEDADGQLSKDELYSLSLRLNIFPKYHYFLKKNSS